MLGKTRILSLFPNWFDKINKHEHSCKITYICNKGSTHVRSSTYKDIKHDKGQDQLPDLDSKR